MGYPFFHTGNNYRIYLFVFFKMFESVNYNRFAVNF